MATLYRCTGVTKRGLRCKCQLPLDPYITGMTPENIRCNYHKIVYDDICCAICLDNMKGEPIGKKVTHTTCAHYFHKACLDKWFEKHTTCPSCRCKLIDNPTGSDITCIIYLAHSMALPGSDHMVVFNIPTVVPAPIPRVLVQQREMVQSRAPSWWSCLTGLGAKLGAAFSAATRCLFNRRAD
jgi:hypothetical protein